MPDATVIVAMAGTFGFFLAACAMLLFVWECQMKKENQSAIWIARMALFLFTAVCLLSSVLLFILTNNEQRWEYGVLAILSSVASVIAGAASWLLHINYRAAYRKPQPTPAAGKA
ncbi:MAG TPA: hypothetical protein VGE59_00110 [Patescibacteria group bacterium]